MSAAPGKEESFFTLRRVYWAVLVGLMVLLVWLRIPEIWPGDLTFLDQGLLVFLALLLLLPLVAEAEFFGFKLRRQIESVRRDLQRDIQAVQQSVVSSTSIRSDIYNLSGIPLLSPAALEELRRDLQLAPGAAESATPHDEGLTSRSEVPETNQELFRIRYRLEQALEDLAGLVGFEGRNVTQFARALEAEGYFGKRDLAAFREVWTIASRAIHGEPVDDRQVGFVMDAFPVLMRQLESVRISYLDDG